MNDLTLTQRGTQHTADLVPATPDLLGVDRDDVQRDGQCRCCAPDCDGGRVLVSDLWQDDHQVDVAVPVLLTACQRAEQDDLEWIKLLDDGVYDLRQPFTKGAAVGTNRRSRRRARCSRGITSTRPRRIRQRVPVRPADYLTIDGNPSRSPHACLVGFTDGLVRRAAHQRGIASSSTSSFHGRNEPALTTSTCDCSSSSGSATSLAT